MATILYEETLGSYSCRHFIPHVQERFIMSKPNVDHSVEVYRYGCQKSPLRHDMINPPPPSNQS